jgi:hypothetical protein
MSAQAPAAFVSTVRPPPNAGTEADAAQQAENAAAQQAQQAQQEQQAQQTQQAQQAQLHEVKLQQEQIKLQQAQAAPTPDTSLADAQKPLMAKLTATQKIAQQVQTKAKMSPLSMVKLAYGLYPMADSFGGQTKELSDVDYVKRWTPKRFHQTADILEHPRVRDASYFNPGNPELPQHYFDQPTRDWYQQGGDAAKAQWNQQWPKQYQALRQTADNSYLSNDPGKAIPLQSEALQERLTGWIPRFDTSGDAAQTVAAQERVAQTAPGTWGRWKAHAGNFGQQLANYGKQAVNSTIDVASYPLNMIGGGAYELGAHANAALSERAEIADSLRRKLITPEQAQAAYDAAKTPQRLLDAAWGGGKALLGYGFGRMGTQGLGLPAAASRYLASSGATGAVMGVMPAAGANQVAAEMALQAPAAAPSPPPWEGALSTVMDGIQQLMAQWGPQQGAAAPVPAQVPTTPAGYYPTGV